MHPTRRQIFAGKSDTTFWTMSHMCPEKLRSPPVQEAYQKGVAHFLLYSPNLGRKNSVVGSSAISSIILTIPPTILSCEICPLQLKSTLLNKLFINHKTHIIPRGPARLQILNGCDKILSNSNKECLSWKAGGGPHDEIDFLSELRIFDNCKLLFEF